MRYIKIKSPNTIDVHRIHDAIRLLGFRRQDIATAEFLSTLKIHGQRFNFVANDRGWDRLRIICQDCQKPKCKLILVEGDWRCRTSCHRVAVASRCRPPLVSGVEAHFLRPLRLLIICQMKFNATTTPRQYAIMQNKIRRLRASIGEYVCGLYDDGQFPVPLPDYFEALSRIL